MKDKIKNGENISVADGITVINNVSIAEKVKEEEKAPVVEAPSVEAPAAPEVKVEAPVVEAPVFPEVAPIAVEAAPTPVVSEPFSMPAVAMPDLSNPIQNSPVNMYQEQPQYNQPIMSSASSFQNLSGNLNFNTPEDVESFRRMKHEKVDEMCNAILEVVIRRIEETNKIDTIRKNIFGEAFKDENNSMNIPKF